MAPFSTGGSSSFEKHFQSTEERVTLYRHHHFNGSMAARAYAPAEIFILNCFVCFFQPGSLLIPVPQSLCQNFSRNFNGSIR